MVKHIILWKLRSEMSASEKQSAAKAIKEGLESLQGQVPGLSEEALKGYAVHPAHVAVANGVVRPNTELRTCLDYEI